MYKSLVVQYIVYIFDVKKNKINEKINRHSRR